MADFVQEGLAIKAERMKKKLTGGKKKVEIDEIKVKIFVLLQLLVDINAMCEEDDCKYPKYQRYSIVTNSKIPTMSRIPAIQVTNKRANYDAEQGLFVGLTFDSEDPVEEIDNVSIAPTEATEVDDEENVEEDEKPLEEVEEENNEEDAEEEQEQGKNEEAADEEENEEEEPAAEAENMDDDADMDEDMD